MFGSKLLRGVIACCLVSIVGAGVVGADVSRFWEWEDDPETDCPRRKLRVAVNPGEGDTLIGGIKLSDLVSDAVDMWNMAQDGWELCVVESGTPSEIFVSLDSTLKDGGAQANFLAVNGEGKVVQRGVQINPDGVKGKFKWGTAGATKDPRAAMKHEIGHCLKLSHMGGSRATSGKVMDPGGSAGAIIGDHDHNMVTEDDGDHGDTSAGEKYNPQTKRVEKDGKGVTQDADFNFPVPGTAFGHDLYFSGDLFIVGGADVSVSPLEEQGGLFGTQVPELNPGIVGLQITTVLDPGSLIDPLGVIDVNIRVPLNNTGLTYGLGNLDMEFLYSNDFRIVSTSQILDGQPSTLVDLSLVNWVDSTFPGLVPDISIPGEIGFQFQIQAPSLFQANQPNSQESYVMITTVEAPRLEVDISSVSLASGGTQSMFLDGGLGHAGYLYWILGSASGTAPGFPSGPFDVPLVFDAYTLFTLQFPNTLVLNSLNLLDPLGQAPALLPLPPGLDPTLAGLELQHAYVVLDPSFGTDAVSNSRGLMLLP